MIGFYTWQGKYRKFKTVKVLKKSQNMKTYDEISIV